jgi:hypothetical protein
MAHAAVAQLRLSGNDAHGAAGASGLPVCRCVVRDSGCCGDNTQGAAAVAARLPLRRDLVRRRGRARHAPGYGGGEERGEGGEYGDRKWWVGCVWRCAGGLGRSRQWGSNCAAEDVRRSEPRSYTRCLSEMIYLQVLGSTIERTLDAWWGCFMRPTRRKHRLGVCEARRQTKSEIMGDRYPTISAKRCGWHPG